MPSPVYKAAAPAAKDITYGQDDGSELYPPCSAGDVRVGDYDSPTYLAFLARCMGLG